MRSRATNDRLPPLEWRSKRRRWKFLNNRSGLYDLFVTGTLIHRFFLHEGYHAGYFLFGEDSKEEEHADIAGEGNRETDE